MNPLLPDTEGRSPALSGYITAQLITATDPRISYSGTQDPLQNYFETPPPSPNYSALTYTFNGTGVTVVAQIFSTEDSINPHPIYKIRCLIDGQELQARYPSNKTSSQVSQYDMIICSTFAGEQSAINDPTHHISNPLSHTLILNLTWTSQDNIPPISLDYMVVSDPPPNSDNMMYWASNSLVKTSLSESDFGWGMDNDLNCGQTSTQGSQLILPFTGVSATWYGFHKPDMRSQSSATPPATYSVDNGDESPFDTVPLPDGTPTNATWLMQQLFRTQFYPYGNHTLKVAYKANNTTNRLTFCTLLVHNLTATNNTAPSSATPSLSVAPPPPSAQAHQHHNEHETMAGGIGGGVAALIVLTFMAFFSHRCRRRVRLAEDRYDNHDQVAQPFPVPTEQTTSYLGPHKARASLQSVGNPFMQEAEITPPVSKWTRRATFSGGTRSIVVVASGAPEPEVSANNAETQSVATTVAPASAAQVPNQQQTHSRQSPLSLDAIHPIHLQNSQEIYGLGGGMRVTVGAGAETPISMPPPSYTL